MSSPLLSQQTYNPQISPKLFLLKVLKDSFHSYHHPQGPSFSPSSSTFRGVHSSHKELEPSLHEVLSVFQKLSSSYAIPSSLEDQCYKALMLFTGDHTLNFQEKLSVIEKYLPASSSKQSPVPDLYTSFSPSSSSSHERSQDFKREKKIRSVEERRAHEIESATIAHSSLHRLSHSHSREYLESDVILLSDLLNGKSSPQISSKKPFLSPVKESSPGKSDRQAMKVSSTPPVLTPILKSTKVPSSEHHLRGMTQDSFSSTTRFSDSKTHDHSSPLFMSSPLQQATTYVTEFPLESSSSNANANPNKTAAETLSNETSEGESNPYSSSSLPHLMKTSHSKSVQLAEKYWIQRSLRLGFSRILQYHHNRSRSTSLLLRQQQQKQRGQHSTEKLTKFKLFQFKKSNKLIQSSSFISHQQHSSFDSSPLSSPASSSQKLLSSSSASPHSIRDILPSPATIRILALFERFMIQHPIGNFNSYSSSFSSPSSSSHGNQSQSNDHPRHPAPSLYVYLTKLSPRFNLQDSQEVWLRNQIIQFLKMETLKVCYYLWSDLISSLILAKEFYKNKLLRIGLEGLQDYSLCRCRYHSLSLTSTRARGVARERGSKGGEGEAGAGPGSMKQRFLNEKLFKFQQHKLLKSLQSLQQFQIQKLRRKKVMLKSIVCYRQRMRLKALRLWRDRVVKRFKIPKQLQVKLRNQTVKNLSLVGIYFKRFYNRLKIFPKGKKLRRKRDFSLKFLIFWKWFHLHNQTMKIVGDRRRAGARERARGGGHVHLEEKGEDRRREEERMDPLRVNHWDDIVLIKFWNKMKIYWQYERGWSERRDEESGRFYERALLEKGYFKWRNRIIQKKTRRVITRRPSIPSFLSSSSPCTSSPLSSKRSQNKERLRAGMVSSSSADDVAAVDVTYDPSSTHPYRDPTFLIYLFYIRWKQFTEKQIQSRLKILKHSKYVRYLLGYPINSGQCLISILPSSSPAPPPPASSPSRSPAHASSSMMKRGSSSWFHPFLGYKAYRQIYEMNLGSLLSSPSSSFSSSRSFSLSPTPIVSIRYLPCHLSKGFHLFQTQLQKLFHSQQTLLLKGTHFYLRKHFLSFLKRIRFQRNSKRLAHKILSRSLGAWKFQFVFSRNQRRGLATVWKYMKRLHSSRLLLRSWYLKSDYYPLLRRGFDQIKRHSHLSYQRTTHIISRQTHWRLHRVLRDWRQLFRITQWFHHKLLKKYFNQVFIIPLLHSKKMKRLKLQTSLMKLQRRSAELCQQSQALHRFEHSIMKRSYWKRFRQLLDQKKELRIEGKEIIRWFHRKILRNSLYELTSFVQRKKLNESLFQRKLLKLCFWKLFKKFHLLKLQRFYSKITRNYYLNQFQRRYMKRWAGFAKKRMIRRKKVQRGDQYFSLQRQLFVVSLLKNLARC